MSGMFDSLIARYVNEFSIKGEPVLKAILGCTVPCKILLDRYERFPENERIESLDENKKRELWLYAKELVPNGTTDDRIKASKIIFVIGTLL
jgi:hypothetical protein